MVQFPLIFSLDAAYIRFNNVGANLNQPISLKCRSDVPIDIFYNNIKLVEAQGYTLNRRSGVELTLTIASVKLKDIGKYTCKSTTPPQSADAELQLRRKSIALSCSALLHNVILLMFSFNDSHHYPISHTLKCIM